MESLFNDHAELGEEFEGLDFEFEDDFKDPFDEEGLEDE